MAVLLEALGKIALGGKAGKLRHLSDIIVGACQKFLTGFEPDAAQKAHRGTAEAFGKSMDEIIFIQVGDLRQIVKGNGAGIIAFDILLYLDALLTGFYGRNVGGKQAGMAREAHDHNLEEILADEPVARALFRHLGQKGLHDIAVVRIFAAAVKNQMPGVVGKIKIRALDAKNNIFQRNIAYGNLRVGDICIYNNEIIFFDRKDLVFDQVVPIALDHIAQFGKRVGVRHAGPVVLIFGIGNVKEAQLERADVAGAHIISGNRHKNPSQRKKTGRTIF